MPTSHQVRKQLVRDALKEKAPRMFWELEKSGKLEQFVHERAFEMENAYTQDYLQVVNESGKEGWAKGNGLQAMRDVNAALSRLTEQVLNTWLEFSDPPTTASERES